MHEFGGSGTAPLAGGNIHTPPMLLKISHPASVSGQLNVLSDKMVRDARTLVSKTPRIPCGPTV